MGLTKEQRKRQRSQWKGFERLVAHEIGRWWVGDKQAFKRLACSGAFPRKKADGDVVPAYEAAESFPFAVECKRRPTQFSPKDLLSMLSADECPVFDWFNTMNELEVVKGGKKMRWLVVFEQSGRHILIFGREEMLWLTDRVGKLGIKTFRFDDGRDAREEDAENSLYVCLFKGFLDWCDNTEALGAPKSLEKENDGQEPSCKEAGGLGTEES